MLNEITAALAVQPQAINRILHENTLSSAVYRLHFESQAPLILKLFYDPERWRRELYFLSHLQGSYPVPVLINSLEPTSTHSGAVLLKEIPGVLLSSLQMSRDLAFQMGQQLAVLHQMGAEAYGDVSSNLESSDPQSEILAKLTRSIAECEGQVSGELLIQCETYVEQGLSSPHIFDGPCIVHRDYKPGNILVADGRIAGVIDWENARGSFAQEEFATMERLVWSHDTRSKTPFLEGYSSVRPVPELETLLPILTVCKTLGILGFAVKRGLSNIKEPNLAFLHSFFQRAVG